MTHKIVGRQGRMDGEKIIDEEIVVELVDGGDKAIGQGATEAEAVEDAKRELARFRAEQEALNTPEVLAAREAYKAALRKAQGNLAVE